MKDHPSSLKVCISAALGLMAAMSANPHTASETQSQTAERDVIVILRDQLPNVAPVRRGMDARAAAVAAAQGPVVAQLQHDRSRTVTTFRTINAFSTKVTAIEAAQLAVHPMVQAVIPDKLIYMRRPINAERAADGKTNGAFHAATPASGLCGTLEPEALQLTHTAYSDPSIPQAQRVVDGNGQFITGKGVKVAFLADGLDPNIAGFIRPDGSHVFIDYQDFSGDPAGTPTAGGEAFGDASSIAAQDDPHGTPLVFDISQYVNPAHPLPSPCDIRIRGMAPGASLVGLKVFSQLGYTTTSTFVQAIEYAVIHDDVDVINESFGGNVYPDTANDPTSLANAAAVRAGVTVTVSTGDAGSAGTLGSPSTDPFVISAGASTQFRVYSQTGQGAQPLAAGYLSGNISSLSSGGFSQLSARTVDVVAPGDLGWALCSTNTTLYLDCSNLAATAAPSPVQVFGGTSESAPLTAGEAALVIQAYRSTHRGADPSPALVKRIIMSSAADLGAPSSEEGAGLINSLEAVRIALSVGHSSDDSEAADDDHAKSYGEGLLFNSTALALTDAPNAHRSHTFRVTNTGATTRHLHAALQALGVPVAGNTLNLQLNPATDPSFVDLIGLDRSYVLQKFTVPQGAEHLDAEIAWQTTTGALVRLSLLDPSGRQAAYSLPQGSGNGYGHVDVVHPAQGIWTAIIFTRDSAAVGYTGPVQFTWAAENYVNVGSVYPPAIDLPPGATRAFTADFFMPMTPGDLASAIRFRESAQDGADMLPEIPVTLRSLVPLGPTGGSFSGTLTGGNGRPGAGPTQTFEFDVPSGVNNLSLALETADNGYVLEGLLIDPNGMQLSVQPNYDPLGNPQYGLELFRYNPQPGRWRFILLQNFYSSGNQTSLPYTARIGFNSATILTKGLPNDPQTKLSAAAGSVTATINVVNNGTVLEAFFADARLAKLNAYTLSGQACGPVVTLPGGGCKQFTVPTETTKVQFTAVSVVPIEMDAYNVVAAGYVVGGTFSPDIFARPPGHDRVTASLSEPEIPYGPWQAAPALIGPFGPAGAPTEPVTESAVALAEQFDAAVTADSGDIWADLTLGSNTFNPLLLPSGAAGIITLKITPDTHQIGTTVRGYIYVDTYNPIVGTGDEVVRIPYSYTIAP